MALVFGSETLEEARARAAERFSMIAEAVEESRREENIEAAKRRFRIPEEAKPTPEKTAARKGQVFPDPALRGTEVGDRQQRLVNRYTELLEEIRQSFPTRTPPGTTIESLALERLEEEFGDELRQPERDRGPVEKLLRETIAGTVTKTALKGLAAGAGFLEETPGVGGPLFRQPRTGKTAFEEGAEISRPVVQAAQPIVAEPFEQVEAAGIPGVSPAAGGVATAIESQIVEDIATEVINPAGLVLVAPLVMQATQGLRGAALAAQMSSNLLATGMEPALVRGTLRGLTVIGTRGAAAARTLPKAIKETPIIQRALANAREFPETGARPFGGGEGVQRGVGVPEQVPEATQILGEAPVRRPPQFLGDPQVTPAGPRVGETFRAEPTVAEGALPGAERFEAARALGQTLEETAPRIAADAHITSEINALDRLLASGGKAARGEGRQAAINKKIEGLKGLLGQEPSKPPPDLALGDARQPPGKPPRIAAGAGGGDSAVWRSAVDKLIVGLKSTVRKLGPTEVERTIERGQRLGLRQAVIERARAAGKSPQEAFREGQRALRGELAKFTGPDFGLSEAENQALWQHLLDYDFGRKAFDQVHVGEALIRIANGEPLRRFEINALRKVYGDSLANALSATSKKASKVDALANAITIPRTILSSFDLSYPFRQGIKTSVRHPKEFFGNFKTMVKAFMSEGVTKHVDEVMRTDALPVQVTTKDGVVGQSWGEISEAIDILRPLPGEEAALLAKEEGFISDFVSGFPGIRNAARAFITYGNKLRSDIGRYWVQRWIRNGEEITPERLQALGNLLNRLTGRGTLGDNAIAKAIQVLAWAPRLRVSGPQAYAQMFHKDPLIRRIAIENLVSFVGGGVAILGLAKASGAADVSLKPGSDFGKMRFGNVRISLFGHDQLIARTVYQVVTGETTDYLTGTRELGSFRDRLGSSLLRYFRSGQAPEGSLVTDIFVGKNFLGQDLGWDFQTLGRELPNRLIPLALQEIYDTWKNQGPLAAIITAPLTLTGMPTSAYETAAQVLAGAYNDHVRAGDFGPDAPLYKDEIGTIRSENIKQHDDLKDKDEARNLEARDRNQAQRLDVENELQLPDLARNFLAGAGNNAALMDQYSTYRERVSAVTAASFFENEREPKTDAEKAVAEWGKLNSSDPRFLDPVMGEKDIDAFITEKDRLFGLIRKINPRLAEVLETRTRSVDPDVQAVEPQIKRARELRNDFFDIPKYTGLKGSRAEQVRKSDEIDEVKDSIQEEARRIAAQTGDPEVDTQRLWRQRLLSLPLWMRQWVQKFIIRPTGGSSRRRLTRVSAFRARGGAGTFATFATLPGADNPERFEFRLQHPELIEWFPGLFGESRELAATLGEASPALAGVR